MSGKAAALNRSMPLFAVLAASWLCLMSAAAQTKPPESASKVKKVLLYNKIGGWMGATGIEAVKAVFTDLSAKKGFELVQLADASVITLDYLNQFQVIVWNNNTDGAASVPSAAARQAVLDYLDQGGGWVLIHNAGDHGGTWPGLTERLGTGFSYTGKNGRAEVVLDEAGRNHKELKWMMEGFPETFPLEDRWMNFRNTVRPLIGVTVVATSRGLAESPGIILTPSDSSGDNVYLWAREVGKGRMFYNAIGFGNWGLMEQQDSIVPRLYWENLRYAAGDYQNGCTTPAIPGYDPRARVHNESMCPAVGLTAASARKEWVVAKGGFRTRIVSPERPLRIRLLDLRGTRVWERALAPDGTGEITLDDAIRPGVYLLEIRGTTGAFRSRVVLP